MRSTLSVWILTSKQEQLELELRYPVGGCWTVSRLGQVRTIAGMLDPAVNHPSVHL